MHWQVSIFGYLIEAEYYYSHPSVLFASQMCSLCTWLNAVQASFARICFEGVQEVPIRSLYVGLSIYAQHVLHVCLFQDQYNNVKENGFANVSLPSLSVCNHFAVLVDWNVEYFHQLSQENVKLPKALARSLW
jgi:hypothetical protein